MNGKRAIKKSSANYPAKKSLRLVKAEKEKLAVREQMSPVELGNIMLKETGVEACQSGYGTTDPEWVGRYALDFNDINPDGTLN